MKTVRGTKPEDVQGAASAAMKEDKRMKKMHKAVCLSVLLGYLPAAAASASEGGSNVMTTTTNPMFPGTGLCDPHVRIKGDVAYLYLTHDKSPDNRRFTMEDWWILSSSDLVHWKHEDTVRPGASYLGEGYASCWAVDVAHVGEKSYFYFSEKNQATGVLVGDSPVGPWHDPLGKAMITKSDLPEGAEHNPYDPGVFIEDDGTAYLVVGAQEFYLLQLNENMISFKGEPVKLDIVDPEGPYGKGKTDDKPFLFKRNGRYYLSWGCFYAIADNLFGPYRCKGAIITPETTEEKLRYTHDNLQHDRHGSFFEWKGQWYFIFNDMSQTRSRKFRDCSIAAVHFRDNGEIEPLELTVKGIWPLDN